MWFSQNSEAIFLCFQIWSKMNPHNKLIFMKSVWISCCTSPIIQRHSLCCCTASLCSSKNKSLLKCWLKVIFSDKNLIKSTGWLGNDCVNMDELEKMVRMREVYSDCCPCDPNPDKWQKTDGWMENANISPKWCNYVCSRVKKPSPFRSSRCAWHLNSCCPRSKRAPFYCHHLLQTITHYMILLRSILFDTKWADEQQSLNLSWIRITSSIKI